MTTWADEGAPLRLAGEGEALEDALDVAMAVLYQGLPSGSKVEEMQRALRLGDKVAAYQAQVLTAFEMTQEHRHEGHGSVVAWAKTHRHARGPDVARIRRLAH